MWLSDSNSFSALLGFYPRALLSSGQKLWLWRRRLNKPLRTFLAGLDDAALPTIRAVLAPDEIPAPALRAWFGEHWPGEPCRDLRLWQRDLVMLIGLFRSLHPGCALRFCLEAVHTPDCRLFHTDRVGLRLICTYRGPGTQWLDEDNVNRGELGLQGRTMEAANRAMVRDPARIRTMDTGWVAVMKGDAFPGNENGGLVHRAYPCEPGAPARLRLRLDTLAH